MSYVNVVDLALTMVAITTSPRHFYERLPQYISNKRTWFKTPIKFFTSSITLICGTIVFSTSDVLAEDGIDSTYLYIYLAISCLLTLIVIPVVCLIIRIVFALIPNFKTPPILAANLLVPLSPSTYLRMDKKKFAWSVLYFGVYAFIGAQVMQLISVAIMYLLGLFVYYTDTCMKMVRDIDVNGSLPAENVESFIASCHLAYHQNNSAYSYVFSGGLGVIAIIAYFVIINPYLWVLRASVKIPTRRMHRGDALQVVDKIQIFITLAHRDVKRGNWSRLIGRVDKMDRWINSIKRTIAKQNRWSLNLSPIYAATLHRERNEAYSKLIKLDGLHSLMNESRVPDQIRTRLKVFTGKCATIASDRFDENEGFDAESTALQA